MPGIFISYRRDDSGGHAGALARELGQRFGAEHVFLDLDDIRGGQDFVAALEQALAHCHVLVALIGRRWLSATDEQGCRRLDMPADVVRQEIAAALRRSIAVMPILVEDASMPSPQELPEELRPLPARNAVPLRNASWQYDVDRIADELRASSYSSPGGAAAPPPPDFRPGPVMDSRRGLALGLCAAVGIALTGAGVWSFVETRQFVARAAVATGRVIDNVLDGDTYRAVVTFEAASGAPITFRSGVGSDPPSYDVGETVRVLYDPAEPSAARLWSWSSLWGLGTLLSGLGGGALAIAATMIAATVVRHRRQVALIRSGHPIMTVFDSVEQNTRFAFNGRHPYRIVTKWRNPISGELVTFRSQDLWSDPTEQVKHRAITVLVDPARLSNYVMDVSMVAKSPPRRPR